MRTMQRIIRTPFIKRMVFLAGILIVILLVVFALNTLATAKRARAAQIPSGALRRNTVAVKISRYLWKS